MNVPVWIVPVAFTLGMAVADYWWITGLSEF